MIEHDFPEDFTPIAAELQRLPYMSPSRGFADRVISRIDRLNPAARLAPVAEKRHLELQQGGRAAVRRRPAGIVRVVGTAVAGVALVTVAAFMFVHRSSHRDPRRWRESVRSRPRCRQR